jgi:hypothetical protein
MTTHEIEKTAKNLQVNFPLIGHTIRMAAIKKLTNPVTPETIRYVTDALKSKDNEVVEVARIAIHSLKNQGAVDILCEGIIDGTMNAAQAVAIEANLQPKTIGRRCLFFVITGQVEKYLELDFEFQYLRPEYHAAPEAIQQRVRTAIQQSNDHRLMGLFGEVRKKFVAKELTEHEAELMLDVYARNRQMEEIFALLFFAPLPVTVKAIDAIMQAGWQPREDESRELIASLLKIRKTVGEKPQLPPEPEVALGPVFQKWIETGRKEYISKTDQQLRDILKTGVPPEAVAALAALAAKNLLQPGEHEALLKHTHWLVRMAYIALDEIKPETIFADNPVSVEGGGHWINSIVPHFLSKTFFQLKPVNLTPDRLQQLSTAIENAGKNTNSLKNWALLLTQLSGFTLRNTIVIGSYEKQIEDTTISI